MHELSMAQNIIEIVERHVPRESAADVAAIRLRIGELSGIVPESLDFCFSALVRETALAEARLEIERIPIRARCIDCLAEFGVEESRFLCPSCSGGALEILSGRDLHVVDIELHERIEKDS